MWNTEKKFKDGDKVRVTKNCSGTVKGNIYTVSSQTDRDGELIIWTNKPYKGCTCQETWELVTANTLKDRIEALTSCGEEAFKILAEIGGKYTISLPTVPESNRNLAVYKAGTFVGGGLEEGGTVELTVLKFFRCETPCQVERAFKDALLFLANKEGKLEHYEGELVLTTISGKNYMVKIVAKE